MSMEIDKYAHDQAAVYGKWKCLEWLQFKCVQRRLFIRRKAATHCNKKKKNERL